MCCFSSNTTVSGTRIFARMTRPDAQVLVYQMSYTATAEAAMILPLPVTPPAHDGSVRWKSLKEHASFFAALAAGFPEPEPSISILRSKSAAVAADAPLAVHEVGDFIASFVPAMGDFDRLDPRFSIRKDVWSKIPAYVDYGFAVFQLKALSGTPHPIAFEFDTRLRDTLFFPTVHIHDGTVHAEDAFDHMLYLQEARFDAKVGGYRGPDQADSSTTFVRSKETAAAFADVGAGVVDGGLLVHRKRIAGIHPNTDTLVGLVPAATALGCGRCEVGPRGVAASLPAGAASGVLAWLAWVIRRRQTLRGAKD
jgi:hypothetical protein